MLLNRINTEAGEKTVVREIIFPNDLVKICCHRCYHRLCHRRDYVLRDLERKNTNNCAVRHLGYHHHNGADDDQSLGSHF